MVPDPRGAQSQICGKITTNIFFVKFYFLKKKILNKSLPKKKSNPKSGERTPLVRSLQNMGKNTTKNITSVQRGMWTWVLSRFSQVHRNVQKFKFCETKCGTFQTCQVGQKKIKKTFGESLEHKKKFVF